MEDSDSSPSLVSYASRGRGAAAAATGRPQSSSVFVQPVRRLDYEYPRPAPRVIPNIIRVHLPLSPMQTCISQRANQSFFYSFQPPISRQPYRQYDGALSYTSASTVSARDVQQRQQQAVPGPSRMLQHNSKVLSSLIRTAVEPQASESPPVFKQPPAAREEVVSSRCQVGFS